MEIIVKQHLMRKCVILEKYKEKINYIQGHKNIELQEIIKQIYKQI